jgi:hypothetical protein
MIAAIGVVGLVVIGLGIASATVWRADDVLVATTTGSSHTLVTDPGVLELGGDPVTATVTVPDGGPVVLAIGRDTDVAGWVGTDAHDQITGLSGWHTLAVEQVAAPEPTAPADGATPAPSEPATVADPTGSDLWVVEETGGGSAQLEWPAQEGRWSLIAVSTGEAAPTLSLAWPRTVTTPWLWPCVVAGALLVLLAGWLLLRDVRRRRAGLDEPTWHDVSTGMTPVVSVPVGAVDEVPVLTRRQLREAQQARAARPRTGAVPKVAPQAADPATAPEPAPTTTTTATPAPVGTSRRDLRPPTGAIPVTQPSSAATPARQGTASGSAGWTPTSPRTAGATPTSAPPTSTGTTSTAPTRAPPTSPAPTAPADRPVGPPHGRPSWVQGTAEPSAPSPVPASGATTPNGSAGRPAVPPPPGARVRSDSPAGPDASAHAGRPTWVRTTAPQAPSADEAATAGSRADAWRRAWGLPATEGTSPTAVPEADPKAHPQTDPHTSSKEEQR